MNREESLIKIDLKNGSGKNIRNIKKQSCQCMIKKRSKRFPVIHLPKSRPKCAQIKYILKSLRP